MHRLLPVSSTLANHPFTMHLRSLPRWLSLTPRARAASSAFRAGSSAYSTATFGSTGRGEQGAKTLLVALKDMADERRDVNDKEMGKRGKPVKVCKHSPLQRT